MKYAAIALAIGGLATCGVQAQGQTEQPMRGVKYAEDKPASIFYECRTAHTFEQTFRRVSSGDPQQIVWSIGGKPSGECGIVREARFVGTVREGVPFLDWHYRVEYRATSKSARQGALQCSEVKDVEETFATDARPQRVDCDTVYFSNGCYSPDFPCLGEGTVVVQ